MNRKIAMFLFAIGLAASASAGHMGYMDEIACREYCEMEYKNCVADKGTECHLVQIRCWNDCMHI